MTLNFTPIPDSRDAKLTERLQTKLDGKTKPIGSLGRIESLALQIGQIQGTETPALAHAQLLVCAGDHGIAARGVSAYPSDVTWQMVENFLSGGAAVSVLAREMGVSLTVVDCGVRHTFAPRDKMAGKPNLLIRKVARITADCAVEPAMTPQQCLQAIANGCEVLRGLPGNVVMLGEMGIGNSSSAALIMSRLTQRPIADCTGRGTGLGVAALKRKIDTLGGVLVRHAEVSEPLDVLATFGGFEIATLVGVILQAAAERRVIVVDGFITTAAVLVARALSPHVLGYCVFAHRSGERGHTLMLSDLGVTPLLDLGLRLGEGSGAALAWPLLRAACALLRDMASFESAGVSQAQRGAGVVAPITEPVDDLDTAFSTEPAELM